MEIKEVIEDVKKYVQQNKSNVHGHVMVMETILQKLTAVDKKMASAKSLAYNKGSFGKEILGELEKRKRGIFRKSVSLKDIREVLGKA